jgi:uncharacterized membrane protein
MKNSLVRDKLMPWSAAAILLACIAAFVVRYPTSIWAMGDYDMDSLSNAINMAYRLADLRLYAAPSMGNHPGVPYYLLSWLGLAMAGYPLATPDLTFFNGVLAHAERFRIIMIAISTLAGACGIVAFIRSTQKIVPRSVTILALVLWVGSTPASLTSFLMQSIDTLGPALNAAFLIVLWRLANKPRFEVSDVVLAGTLAAVCYLTKLSYLNIVIGLCAALATAVLFEARHRLWNLRMAGLFLFSFAIVVLAAAVWIIEWTTFLSLVEFHQGIIFRGGVYGTGAPGVFNADELQRALTLVWQERAYAVPMALAGGFAAIAGGMAVVIWRKQRLPIAVFGIGTGAAAVFAAASVLKHYAIQYTAGVAATLPALCVALYLVLGAWNIRLRAPVLIGLIMAAVVGLVPPAGRAVANYMEEHSRLMLDANADRVKIEELVARSSSPVGFAYRTPFREYAEGFLLENSGVPRLIFAYLAGEPKTMNSFTERWVSRDIGAYVVDKEYFRSVAELKAAPNVNLLGPPVAVREGDEVIELATAYLVLRNQPASRLNER